MRGSKIRELQPLETSQADYLKRDKSSVYSIYIELLIWYSNLDSSSLVLLITFYFNRCLCPSFDIFTTQAAINTFIE